MKQGFCVVIWVLVLGTAPPVQAFWTGGAGENHFTTLIVRGPRSVRAVMK